MPSVSEMQQNGTMEDGVRLLLETSNTLVVRLFRKATGYKGTSQPTPVVSYFEEQLSLNDYYKRNPKILQLLLPQSDKNEWVDAILLCNLGKLYVVHYFISGHRKNK